MEKWKTFHTTKSITHARIYQVSTKGNVRSRKASDPEHPIFYNMHKQQRGGYKGNYRKVSIGRELGYQYVHKLVLEAFVCKRPEGKQANHIDLDPTNNSVDNLEWLYPHENASHMQKAYGGVNQYTDHRTKEEAQLFIKDLR